MVIAGKLLLGILGAVLGVLLTSSRRVRALSARRFGALAIGLGVGSRLALFAVVFVALRFEVRSDVPAYYYPQAKAALAGQLVYRDFPSSYAPLFPYLAAGAVALWDSPKSLVLLAVALEALSLPLWLRAARAAFDEDTARRALLLYLTSALPLVNVALEGQNQAYCAFLLAASFALLAARRPLLSGLVAGAAGLAVKFTGVLVAAGPFVGAGDRRARWLAGGALVPLLGYGIFALAGADLRMPLAREAGLRSSGNLPFLLTALGAGAPTGVASAIVNVVVALALLAALGWALRRSAATGPRAALFASALVLTTFMILGKKSPTSYLVQGFFPLAATAAAGPPSRRGALAFGLFGAVAVIEPTLWFNGLKPGDLGLLWQAGAAATRARALVLLLCDLLLVGGYVALGVQAARRLAEGDPRHAATPAR